VASFLTSCPFQLGGASEGAFHHAFFFRVPQLKGVQPEAPFPPSVTLSSEVVFPPFSGFLGVVVPPTTPTSVPSHEVAQALCDSFFSVLFLAPRRVVFLLFVPFGPKVSFSGLRAWVVE